MFEKRGYSLIELLIALFVNTLLLNLIFKIYINYHHTLQFSAALISIESNAETASAILSNDLHHALKESHTRHSISLEFVGETKTYYIKDRRSLYVKNAKEDLEIINGISDMIITSYKKFIMIDLALTAQSVQKHWYITVAI